MPTLRQLEYLVALADTGNFRRAAERSNTTQPTLSEQIKTLEERIDVQLVERTRSGALLTTAGQHVVAIARRMIRDANEIRGMAGIGQRKMTGLLKVGIPPTIGPYLLPAIVPALHKAYPELKLYVREEQPSTLPQSLEAGTYDVIVTLLPLKGEDLQAVDLFREALFLTVAADHPLATKTKVERADLKDQEVLTLGPGYQLHDTVLAPCDEFGARIRLDYEGTSLDMLREMVITGLGITFMPGLYVRRELKQDPNLKLHEIHGRSIYRMVGMAWRKSSARRENYEAIADLFRETVRAVLPDINLLG